MTIEELRILVGAPSVEALKECLSERNLTLDKCQDVSVREELRIYFATYCRQSRSSRTDWSQCNDEYPIP